MISSNFVPALYLACAITISLWVPTAASSTADSHDHMSQNIDSHAMEADESQHEGIHDHEEHNNRVHLDASQQQIAGIQVETLSLQPVAAEIEAPGELRLNAYASSQVTPRIEAQIVERHAQLGDTVSKGQVLVTLSSASMAEAQGAALIASKEWQRLRGLGKNIVSDQRHMEARISFQQAKAKLLAYGMTTQQTDRLLRQTDIASADGSFSLLSPQAGTVIRDDFIVGKMVEPGELLFEITDETTLWVEARLNPDAIPRLRTGAAAQILVGGQWISGKLIQVHHALDETTRTLAVRLEVPNPDDNLHPGQFVTARIQTSDGSESALQLPAEAVLRSPDGDWQVYVEEEAGEFEAREVTIIRQLADRLIIQGLEAGSRVVTRGAFFVQSELAKSGFDVHNH